MLSPFLVEHSEKERASLIPIDFGSNHRLLVNAVLSHLSVVIISISLLLIAWRRISSLVSGPLPIASPFNH